MGRKARIVTVICAIAIFFVSPSLVYAILGPYCFPDSFGTQILLSKPGVRYSLAEPSLRDILLRDILIAEEPITYPSHYNPETRVILRYECLFIRIEIPYREVPVAITEWIIGDAEITALRFEEASEFGWDAKVSSRCGWTTPEGERISVESYLLKKGDVGIDICPAECAWSHCPGEWGPPAVTWVRGAETETQAVAKVWRYDAATFPEGMGSEVADVLTAIGFSSDKEAILKGVAECRVTQPLNLAPAIDIDPEEFDWEEAMKTELLWLRDNGVITGLSDRDIVEASAACQWGRTIVFRDGKWKPYYQTHYYPDLAANDYDPIGGDEQSKVVLPDLSPKDCGEAELGKIPPSFNWMWVAIGAAIGAIIVLGIGFFVWRWKLASSVRRG